MGHVVAVYPPEGLAASQLRVTQPQPELWARGQVSASDGQSSVLTAAGDSTAHDSAAGAHWTHWARALVSTPPLWATETCVLSLGSTPSLQLASAVRVGWWAAPDSRPSLASGLENCDHSPPAALTSLVSVCLSVCLCLSICSRHSCLLLSSSLTPHVCCLQQLLVPRWSFSRVHGQPRLGLPR